MKINMKLISSLFNEFLTLRKRKNCSMYTNFCVGFIACSIFVINIAGCTPQENKKQEEAKAPVAAAPKNFERAVPPVIMANPQERVEYVLTHFWDKFNFRDTMYCHAPDITDQAFAEFIYLFPYVSYDKMSKEVKRMLDSATVDVVMYNYFYRLGEHYLYNPNSRTRNDEHFIPFLEHLVSSPKVIESAKIRPQYQLDLAYRNRPGVKASDLTYTLNSGAMGNLYGISARNILLMFYNPDCKECKEVMELLINSPSISAAVSSGRLKILAVYPDEDIEVWKRYQKNIPPTWINGCDKALAVRNKEIYDLRAIPTLYLLDKDKKVIFRDTSVSHIQMYIDSNP